MRWLLVAVALAHAEIEIEVEEDYREFTAVEQRIEWTLNNQWDEVPTIPRAVLVWWMATDTGRWSKEESRTIDLGDTPTPTRDGWWEWQGNPVPWRRERFRARRLVIQGSGQATETE